MQFNILLFNLDFDTAEEIYGVTILAYESDFGAWPSALQFGYVDHHFVFDIFYLRRPITWLYRKLFR